MLRDLNPGSKFFEVPSTPFISKSPDRKLSCNRKRTEILIYVRDIRGIVHSISVSVTPPQKKDKTR